jgi:hypothetical protein
MRDDFLSVKAGDPITAEKWNQMQRAANGSQVLRGGENIAVSSFPHGVILNGRHGGGFNHPWRVVSSQLSAKVSPGTINGEYPSIVDADNNITKIDAEPPPLLDLSDPKVLENGVGWIALELKLKEDYRTIETARVVQCDFIVGSEQSTTNPFFFFGLPGIGNFSVRYPLARLQWFSNIGTLSIFQVAMFNLSHTCKPPNPDPDPAKSSLPRHFFFPA